VAVVEYRYPAVMSLRAADTYLGVRNGTVAEAVRRGELAVVCFPGRKQRRVTKEALDEWVRSQGAREAGPSTEAGRLRTAPYKLAVERSLRGA